MHSLFALVLIAATSAVEVRVTDLQQRETIGTVQSWSEQTVQLDTTDQGTLPLPLADVLRVDTITKPTPRELPSSEVLLTDGARLAVDSFLATGPQCVLGGTPLSNQEGDEPLGVTLASVRAVRMMPLDPSLPSLAKEWRDLLAGDPAGDLIVIRKPGAANLNFVEGTLGDVTDQAVKFDLDGEEIDVNRAKVFGIIYFRRVAADAKTPDAVISGPGFKLPITVTSLKEQEFEVRSPSLGTVALPLSEVSSVDYSLARVQYLSDLDLVQDDWNPPAGAATISPLLGYVARDRAFYQPELTLAYPVESLSAEEASSSGLAGSRRFAKGLAIRDGAEIGFRVPRDFTNFRATVGIDPRSRDTARVELTIQGDGKVLASETLLGDAAPVELECKVTGVRQLTIVVRSAGSAPWTRGFGDILHLGGARFVK
ncbi:NPCBM/NEW2 domain-containing protein [Aeoliella sp. ICT_H6.2]|uniref:NPCBM/NEW2 domain-containing protein n=1 Tax=Aeoliella straminimaris TaxID=2954799 RepID=A0A9X2JJI3_9BACT|nr:NPCBM/NEW2 domain-containing protein [Aeoliella straminimaris]MCO6047921.1 NPCBM/NEW2 domain-containing protein [Aeoliella straminimaris]